MKTEHIDKYRQLGLKISYYRKLRGITQEQLAERAGISVNTLSRLECGQSSTSINKFRRILLALDADANYLIGLEVSKVKEAGGDEQVFLRFRHLEDEDQKVVAKTMIALLDALEERKQ
jgi:transcriptional regulator with XRE-family HTH domain